MDANFQSFFWGIATSLAYDLIKAGNRHITDLSLGDNEVKELQKVWEQVLESFTEELYGPSDTDLAKEVANVFRYFIYEQSVADTLIDWALTEREPDIKLLYAAFNQAGFDTVGIPLSFTDLITNLRKHLNYYLTVSASHSGSSLSNRVNTTRIADIQNKIESALVYIQQNSTKIKASTVFHSENIRLSSFFGRKNEIQKLTNLLLSNPSKSVAITALEGMGGIGKTALAKKIAHELAREFPGGVLWADFSSNQGNPLPILASWAQLCSGTRLDDLPSEEIRALVVQRSIATYIQRNGKVLVIFDDVRETKRDSWLKGAHLLLNAIPQNTPVIITTRYIEVALSLRAELFSLDVMNKNDALEFVTAFLPDITKEDGLHLIELVGYLPLAIEIAVSLAKYKEGIDYVIKALENPQSRLDLFELEGKEKENNIWASFSISYNSLSQEAANLFKLLGVFSQGKIKREWIQGVCNNLNSTNVDNRLVDKNLRNLRYLSLIKYADNDREIYQLHPLLKDYSKMLLEKDNELTKISVAHSKYFGEFSKIKQDSIEELELAIENIMQAVRYLYQKNYWNEVINITIQIATYGKFLHKRGLWRNSYELLLYAVTASEKVNDLQLLAVFLCDAGIIERESGNYLNAKNLFEQSAAISKSNNDLYTLSRVLSSLGMIFLYQRQNEEATNAFNDAISYAKVYNNSISLGQAILGIGRIELSRGNTAKAREKILQSIEILKETDSRQLYIFALRAYGEVLSVEKNYDEALLFYNEALGEANKINDIQAQAYTLRGIGDTYRYKNESQKALVNYRKSVRLYKDVGDKAALAGALCCIGEIYFEKQQYKRAKNFFTEGLEYASEPRWRARNQFGLARIMYIKGNQENALKLAHQAQSELSKIGHRDMIMIQDWINNGY